MVSNSRPPSRPRLKKSRGVESGTSRNVEPTFLFDFKAQHRPILYHLATIYNVADDREGDQNRPRPKTWTIPKRCKYAHKLYNRQNCIHGKLRAGLFNKFKIYLLHYVRSSFGTECLRTSIAMKYLVVKLLYTYWMTSRLYIILEQDKVGISGPLIQQISNTKWQKTYRWQILLPISQFFEKCIDFLVKFSLNWGELINKKINK